MEKIRLDLDELEIASFELEDDARAADGGVYANTTVDACYPTLRDTCTCAA